MRLLIPSKASLRRWTAVALAFGFAVAGATLWLRLGFSRPWTTESFLAYAQRVTGTARLQVATLQFVEVFRLEDPATLLGIPLPEVIVEARAPVETTWYLDLNARWSVSVRDRDVFVAAPPLQFNTPAIAVGRLEYRTVRSSLWRREAPVLEKLRVALGPMARRAAAAHLPQVRETARNQVSLFVRAWVLQKEHEGETGAIRVRFADEPASPFAPAAPRRG
ncbi:MAG: hypothetical protein IT578_03335 [Verrucomicrobiae bacterium]|nr:hypothetical protein [Verrucomicrobiae bacterium]